MSQPYGRPAIHPERYAARLARAQALANTQGLAAVLIGVGADLRYFTGYNALPLERLTMLMIPASGAPRLVAPRLEAAPARGCVAVAAGHVEVSTWEETEDPVALVARLVHGIPGNADDRGIRIAVSDRLWAMFVLRLQAALPMAHFTLGSTVSRQLRIVKDPEEVELLRTAALAADRVIDQIATGRLVGRSEADVSQEIRDRLVAEGHDEAEFAIVGSGPNSASPHHEAAERVIQPGEPIVLDIGGPRAGYASDTTRTIWVTGGDPVRGPDPEFLHIYELVQRAHAEATAAVRPGVPAASVDAVARALITGGGYGPQFMHRVGHGIGLEGHEDPYLVAGNSEPLQAGMAFSIEPGIYLEGRYGVRIEDIVGCGETGPIVLNESSRELRVVDG
jgi:Xaa-Pro aminopeptidase